MGCGFLFSTHRLLPEPSDFRRIVDLRRNGGLTEAEAALRAWGEARPAHAQARARLGMMMLSRSQPAACMLECWSGSPVT